MKSFATIVSLAVVLGTAACTTNNPNRPTDTGNMAYPTPLPQGNVATARPASPDTGSMNVPTASGGAIRAGNSTPDTGNMALPSRAQGNSLPRSY